LASWHTYSTTNDINELTHRKGAHTQLEGSSVNSFFFTQWEKSSQNCNLVHLCSDPDRKRLQVPLMSREECPHCRNQPVHVIEVRDENWWQVEHFLPARQGIFGR